MTDSIPEWAIRTKADDKAILEGAVWVQAEADRIIKFAETFFKPQYIKGDFKLLEWQKRFLSSLYAWRWADGRRRFRFANLHVAKKNGKTLLVAIICLYELLAAGEPSPYVACAAASKENASQVFDEIKHSLLNSFENECASGEIQIANHLKKIVIPSLNAKFRTFASQGSRVHGEPTSVCVCDEVHCWKDPELYRALRYNTDARPNGIVIGISTAGNDLSHFYYTQIYTKSKRVLAGDDLDVTWYGEVHEADKDKDFEIDTSQWYAANPSLGISFSEDQFRRDLESAKANMGEWLNFMRLKLNIFTRADETAWLDTTDWPKYERDFSDEELKEFPAVVSADLSEATDPTSISICWQLPEQCYHVKSWAIVPEDSLAERAKSTLPRFEEFMGENSMSTTEGDMIDRNKVFEKIISLCETFDVRQVNFDPHGAYVLAFEIENEGYSVGRVMQSAKNFNSPMQEFARAYKEGRISHNGSAWLKYCFSNVRVEINKYAEIRPYKRKSIDHIDGAIATLLCFVTLFSEEFINPAVGFTTV